MQMHAAKRIRSRGCARSKGPLGERNARAELVDISGSQGLSAQPYKYNQSAHDVFFPSQSYKF
jgi:hypothetical protein